jgi:hypothetical protein
MRELPWAVADGRGYLFVLIPDAEFQKHKKNLKIDALVHRADKPEASLHRQEIYRFDLSEFELIQHGRVGGVRWAAHNLAATALYSDTLRRDLVSLEQSVPQVTAAPAARK